MKDTYKLIGVILLFGIFTILAFYLLGELPVQHAQAVRKEAADECQARLDKKLVNIAVDDQQSYLQSCVAAKLALWK